MCIRDSSFNVGLDLALFNNRIEFIADAYYKKTDNLLMQASLPTYVRVSRMPIGAAKDRRQSLRSVESRSYRQSVDTFDGRSSGSESV